MLHLANDNIDNEMLKTMWLNALREDMRKILSASDSPTTSVERLAASADSIQDASERGTIASVNSSDLMVKAIEMLTKRIEVMETRRFPHHRSRSHSRVVVRRIGRLLDHSPAIRLAGSTEIMEWTPADGGHRADTTKNHRNRGNSGPAVLHVEPFEQHHRRPIAWRCWRFSYNNNIKRERIFRCCHQRRLNDGKRQLINILCSPPMVRKLKRSAPNVSNPRRPASAPAVHLGILHCGCDLNHRCRFHRTVRLAHRHAAR